MLLVRIALIYTHDANCDGMDGVEYERKERKEEGYIRRDKRYDAKLAMHERKEESKQARSTNA